MKTTKRYLLLEEINKKLMDKLSAKIKIPKKNEVYLMNVHDAKAAFEVLNREIFLSKLKDCEIIVEDFDPKKHVVPEEGVSIGNYSIHFSTKSWIKFETTEPRDISILESRGVIILVNKILDIHFADFISDLTHEMIHQYDFLYGPGKLGMVLNKMDELRGKKPMYDAHGLYFKEKAKDIRNKFNINVNTTFTMDTESKKTTITEEIDRIIEGVEESDTLKFNGCKDRNAIRFAKLLRKLYKDSGSNRIEIIGGGKEVVIRGC